MKTVDLTRFNLPKDFRDKTDQTRNPEDSEIKTALQLFNNDQKEIPKLLNPFFQKVGLSALVGASDTGKSTLLRQLALHIALKEERFVNFSIDSTEARVLYISTEDDPYTVSYAIRKQAESLKKTNPHINLDLLDNLVFIFNPENTLMEIKNQLNKQKFDLVIIDAFADIFTGEINANTQVRKFLNDFDRIAKTHECLMIFLHHIGKRKEQAKAHKDNIIGSQAFEAKMRSVLELKNNPNNKDRRDLWVLKANFLHNDYKKSGYILDFDENLIFSNTGKRGSGVKAKSKDDEAILKILQLHEEGNSSRKIEELLERTEFSLKKSAINNIILENKSE